MHTPIKGRIPHRPEGRSPLRPGSVGICVVFDIANNRARLIAHVDYKYHFVFIRFIISHAVYLRGGWEDDCKC